MLIHQFCRCSHCGKGWPGLRYDCPFCNWPREHTDVTPAPTSGMFDPRKDEAPPLPQPVPEPVATPVPTIMDPDGPDPILVVPVPQTPRHLWKEPREPSWDEIAGKPVMTKAQLAAVVPVIQTLPPEPAPPPPAEPAEPVVASSQPHHVGSTTDPLTAFEPPKRRSPRKKKA